eukprot:3339226-Pyramimonas_sp.AAC.2
MRLGAGVPHRQLHRCAQSHPPVDMKFRTWLFYVLISVFCCFRRRLHVLSSFTRPRCSTGHARGLSTARAFQHYSGPCQCSGRYAACHGPQCLLPGQQ